MYINAECICFNGNDGWFLNNQFRALCQYNVLEHKVCASYIIPDSIKYRSIQISMYKNKIFMYPYGKAKKLLFFDIKEKKFSETALNCLQKEELLTRYVGVYKNNIYFYLIDECAFIAINGDTLAQQRFQLSEKYCHRLSSNSMICCEGSILCPIMDRNAVLEFEIETGGVKEHIIQEFSGGVYTIAYDGAFYWITGKDKYCIRWNKENGETDKKWRLPDSLEVYDSKMNMWGKFEGKVVESNLAFLRNALVQGKLWLFPYMSNMILQIDIQTGKFKEIFFSESDKKFVPEKKPCEFLGIDFSNEVIILSGPQGDNNTINLKTLEKKEINFKLVGKSLRDCFFKENLMYEKKDLELKALIESFYAEENTTSDTIKVQFGEKIYRCLVETL